MEAVTIGLDIAKHVFHVHAVDIQGQVTSRQRLRRGEIVSFFSSLSPYPADEERDWDKIVTRISLSLSGK